MYYVYNGGGKILLPIGGKIFNAALTEHVVEYTVKHSREIRIKTTTRYMNYKVPFYLSRY